MKQQRSPNTYTPKERNLYLTGLLGQNLSLIHISAPTRP